MYNNFIIFGSTGGTGIHIVKKLLEQGKNVTIVVRDKTKAKTIFKENYEKIKLVIEEQMGRGTSIKNDELKNALKSTDCLISAIGSSMSSNPKLDEYVAVKELIELAEEAKVKKFALITSLYITRPYTFVSFLLNNLLPFVLGWKSLAENKLRLSKLNYMIIRPGGLVDKEENSKSVGIFQGDRVKGKISRSNLGNAVLLALNDPIFNKNNVTIDMIEVPSGNKFLIQGEENLVIKEDDKYSIITADHFNATKKMNILFTTILFFVLIYLIYIFKK